MEALLWPRKATNCGPATAGLGNVPRTSRHGSLGLHSCKKSAYLPPVQATYEIQYLKRGVD